MMFLGTPDPKALVARLQGYAEDPMWVDHAEVPKSLLLEAINALALAAQQDGVREALEWIAAKPDESNEWDGRDKFHECRDHAREALARLEQAGDGEGE